MPRVINVDTAIAALTAEGTLPSRVRLRQCKYLNNVIEQDHRTVKERTWLAKGYGSFQGAWRTFAGHRSSPYDSERKSGMAGQIRCRRASALHCQAVWYRC